PTACANSPHRIHYPASPTAVSLIILTMHPPPRSTLFPYTTLFRSSRRRLVALIRADGDTERRLHLEKDLRRRRRARQQQEADVRSEEHTSELQSPCNLVCRLLLEKKKRTTPRCRADTSNSHCLCPI